MKVVLDTNVLIAAFIAHGACAELLEHCFLRHDLITSRHILEEFRRNMVKMRHSSADVDQSLRTLASMSFILDPNPLSKRVSRDPDDDMVLATAITGGAHCIVTGDKDLLVLKSHERIPILSPQDFWKFEAKTSGF